VTVTTATSLLSTTTTSLGQVIENQGIVDLPLDGRDPISLVGPSTGVVPVPPNANIHQGEQNAAMLAGLIRDLVLSQLFLCLAVWHGVYEADAAG
jgi:hypothetical protein